MLRKSASKRGRSKARSNCETLNAKTRIRCLDISDEKLCRARSKSLQKVKAHIKIDDILAPE